MNEFIVPTFPQSPKRAGGNIVRISLYQIRQVKPENEVCWRMGHALDEDLTGKFRDGSSGYLGELVALERSISRKES
jgi:hypothetical protein